MAKKTRKTTPKPLRGVGSKSDVLQQRLIDCLPEHDWNIVTAGIAAGYSESYAKKQLARRVKADIDLCRRIADKRTEITATDGERIEKLVRFWHQTVANASVAYRDRLKASEHLGKYYAIFSERRILETQGREQELSEAERAAARELAILWGQRQLARLHGMQVARKPHYQLKSEGTPESAGDTPHMGGLDGVSGALEDGSDDDSQDDAEGHDDTGNDDDPPAGDPVTPQTPDGAPFPSSHRGVLGLGKGDSACLDIGDRAQSQEGSNVGG